MKEQQPLAYQIESDSGSYNEKLVNKIKDLAKTKNIFEARGIFADIRSDSFESVAFLPSVHIDGDVDGDRACDGCEREVRARSCAVVLFEGDEEGDEPIYLCRNCAAATKRAMKGR